MGETAIHRIASFLHLHTQSDVEKHEKVRAGCIAYSLFMLFGTESQELHNESLKQNSPSSGNQLTVDALTKHSGPTTSLNESLSINSVDSVPASPVGSDVEDEENEEDLNGEEEQKVSGHELTPSGSKLMLFDKSAKEKNVKIAKRPQRAHLFDDAVFMKLFGAIIGNGIEDKGKESREKAMKVLKKIEATRPKVLEEYIEAHHVAKYEKWKKFNAPKGKKGKGKKGKAKRKRISPIKRMKTVPVQSVSKKKEENGDGAEESAEVAPLSKAKTMAVLTTEKAEEAQEVQVQVGDGGDVAVEASEE